MQELLKPEDHEEGRVPRTVECELIQDLVDNCIPGDVLTVTGIIRGINNYMDIGGGMQHNFLPLHMVLWIRYNLLDGIEMKSIHFCVQS